MPQVLLIVHNNKGGPNWTGPHQCFDWLKGTRGHKSRRPEVVAVILNCCGTCRYFNSKTICEGIW